MTSPVYYTGGLSGHALEMALQEAFADIVKGFTLPGSSAFTCTFNAAAKEEKQTVMQLTAHCDDDFTGDRAISPEERTLHNLFEAFHNARIQIKIDETGLSVLLPGEKDIEKFFALHRELGEAGFFRFGL